MRRFYVVFLEDSIGETMFPQLNPLRIQEGRKFYLSWSNYIMLNICKDKKDAVIEMTLPEDNSQIFASKYQTVLPSKEELKRLIADKDIDS